MISYANRPAITNVASVTWCDFLTTGRWGRLTVEISGQWPRAARASTGGKAVGGKEIVCRWGGAWEETVMGNGVRLGFMLNALAVA